jgi:hypothetical protein
MPILLPHVDRTRLLYPALCRSRDAGLFFLISPDIFLNNPMPQLHVFARCLAAALGDNSESNVFCCTDLEMVLCDLLLHAASFFFLLLKQTFRNTAAARPKT